VRDIVAKVWAYVIVGIAVGAGIHGYVPTDALAGYMGKDAAWWSVPLVVLAAPLAFMMAVVGVSLPETILLRRVLRPQLIGVFVGVVTVAIIITGYLFNAIL
jgi:uncharacterized membrane protein YraQ (UPF0718 family)